MLVYFFTQFFEQSLKKFGSDCKGGVYLQSAFKKAKSSFIKYLITSKNYLITSKVLYDFLLKQRAIKKINLVEIQKLVHLHSQSKKRETKQVLLVSKDEALRLKIHNLIICEISSKHCL